MQTIYEQSYGKMVLNNFNSSKLEVSHIALESGLQALQSVAVIKASYIAVLGLQIMEKFNELVIDAHLHHVGNPQLVNIWIDKF